MLVVAAEVLDLLELKEALPMRMVVLVEMEQKHQVGIFHQIMEHQVLHPVDSLLVVVAVVVVMELAALVVMVVVLMVVVLVMVSQDLMQPIIPAEAVVEVQ
jgi:hypothetical protein